MKNQVKPKFIKWGRIVFCLLLMSCGSPAQKTGKDTAGALEAKPAKHYIDISMMKFNPAVLTVQKGDSVVFVNNDIVVHDITEQRGQAWSSSPLPNSGSWGLIASETVDYYCSIHPVMKGKIIVQ